MMATLIQKKSSEYIHRGWIGLEAIGVLLLIVCGTVLAVVLVSSLFNSNKINSELANVQSIMLNTRELLKSQGSYDFSSPTSMTNTLIHFGGVPSSMLSNGSTSAASTVINSWDGNVLVAPTTDKKGFLLTYNNVPKTACATLATKLSATALVSEISITGSNNTGAISAERAGTLCQADSGSVGNNILIFQSNG